mgnify:CR=1 FL=1
MPIKKGHKNGICENFSGLNLLEFFCDIIAKIRKLLLLEGKKIKQNQVDFGTLQAQTTTTATTIDAAAGNGSICNAIWQFPP